ncbi:patatin-like phospholipase domain-containing protein 7, partial [Lingula anatina]|uniref:lysophospholipase n=1 Tax=Lingula anatina TaxID=7574 RepID=A0A1S3H5F7_LINAN
MAATEDARISTVFSQIEYFLSIINTTYILAFVAAVVLTICIIFYFTCRKIQAKGFSGIPSLRGPKYRFRKRDRFMFYGKKIMRKVNSFTAKNLKMEKKGLKKRQIVMKLAKQFLQRHEKSKPQLKNTEPPQSFLEADLEDQQSDLLLPPEVLFMLKSVRVFGHFERPIFLELCKHMECKFVASGNLLFKIGESDDSIYVVQNGKIRVFITEQDGTEHTIKDVETGESIHSLLSILDVLTGHPAPYKTVCAKAAVDSTVLKLPANAFNSIFERFPESIIRIVQVIMVRMQRVTFMALHNYLGLSHELINPMFSQKWPPRVWKLHSFNVMIFQGLGFWKEIFISVFDEHAVFILVVKGRMFYPCPSAISKELIQICIIISQRHTHEDSRRMSVRHLSGNASPPRSPRRHSVSIMQNRDELENRNLSDSKFSVLSIQSPRGSPSKYTRSSSQIETEEKVQKITFYDGKDQWSDLKKAESLETDLRQHSDFDAACSKAGVKPPVKQVSDEALGSSKQRTVKKTVNIQEEANITTNSQELTEEYIISCAMQDLASDKLFGLEDKSLLEGKLILRYHEAGTVLVKQGDQDATLMFVVTGSLQVIQQVVGKETEETSLFIAHPGEVVGTLAVLTGEPSFFTIRARTDSRVVYIDKNEFYGIMREHPKIVLNVAHTFVRRMSPFVRQIDFALDWEQIEAGRALYKQNDPSESLYIILNGRLRQVLTTLSGKRELVGEYGRGELIGIVEVLTQTERATTSIAVRDTELAKIPAELLNLIKRKYPQIVTRLIHLLGQRILGSLEHKETAMTLSEHPNVDQRPIGANLNTVAVLPVTDDVPLETFTIELQHALGAIGPTLRLTSDVIVQRLGAGALDSVSEYRLSSWLGQQEDLHRMVLYQCDKTLTPWTQRCIRQADCIFIVTLAESEPTVGKLEKQLENMSVRAQREMILLYSEDSGKPQRTAEWLNPRGWCSSVFHVRCPGRVFTYSRKTPEQIMQKYDKIFQTEPDRHSDFSRLARFLTGTSIGLVLGGGGARGCAHIGMIKSIVEAGIPIDIVGGTSIGAFIGAIWCDERNITRLKQRAREWAMEMNCLWKKIFDLTYPVTSFFTGGSFNNSLEEVFRDTQIEDLWLPYFCITTDITSSKMRVHTSGSLWRYIRASMSLAGYFPPLCDPQDGHLILDGGYCNNLPADVMKTMGAQTIFAIDVGSQDETNLTNYGDKLSGWWLLWKRWNPWAEPVKVPNMSDVQSRLAYVSCVRQMEMVTNSGMCEYLRPPIDKYGTLQFGSFDEIYDVGYNHGKVFFSAMAKGDAINELFKEKSKDRVKPKIHQCFTPLNATFTDLAELVSRIEEPPKFYTPSDETDSEDMDEDGDDIIEVVEEGEEE